MRVPRGREIAFSILNTTLHPPQKHFPGLKTAIPCPGANKYVHSGELEPRHQAIHKTIPPPAAGRARHCRWQGLVPQQEEQGNASGKGSSAAGRAKRCDRQGLVPKHGEQSAATGKGSSRSRKSKALRPARASPAAGRARRCDRQRLVPQQGEQGIATGKG